MKRLTLSLVALLFVGALAGSTYRAWHEDSDLCAGFTPARMLEDPEVARLFFGGWHDGEASAHAQLESLAAELRAVHHCAGAEEVAEPQPSHPPVAPRLPPGHPPIDGVPRVPVFGSTPTHTI